MLTYGGGDIGIILHYNWQVNAKKTYLKHFCGTKRQYVLNVKKIKNIFNSCYIGIYIYFVLYVKKGAKYTSVVMLYSGLNLKANKIKQ